MSHAERRTTLTPARLLIGSLIGGAGITLVALFFGGSPASAAEPSPPPPAHSLTGRVASLTASVDESVRDVVGGTGHTISAVTDPVARAVPTPVQQVATPMREHEPDAVADVVRSATASSALDPVAAAVDSIVDAVPVARERVGAHPVQAIVTPVAQAVDHAVVSIAGLTFGSVDPVLGPPSPGTLALTALPLVTLLPAVPGAGAAGVAAAAGVVGALAFAVPLLTATELGSGSGHPDARPSPISGAGLPAAPTGPGGAPSGQPEGIATGSTASSSSVGAPATAVAAGDFALAAVAAGGTSALMDDRLPSSPVADHDSSPD